MPLTWAVECAAKEGVVCYLDMESDGKVVKMYEKMGFVMVDRFGIHQRACGIDGDLYTHFAMLREPEVSCG